MPAELSPDQQTARFAILDAIEEGQTRLVLSGPAGSGKTTLMRQLIDDIAASGRTVTLCAPTGKAAVRLTESTGQFARTIHQILYREIEEVTNEAGELTGEVRFSGVQSIATAKSVVICDEASMVGERLHRDLTQGIGKAALLYVGDREQLPPVNDTWGANFAEPTALLSAIHRQAAGSPIIQLSMAIRAGQGLRTTRPDGDRYTFRRGTMADAAAWLAGHRAMGNDATLITWRNQLRQQINAEVRKMRGHKQWLQPGDLLVCTRNNHSVGKMNGEVVTVSAIEPLNDDLVKAYWQTSNRPGSGRTYAIVALDGLPKPIEPNRWERLREDLVRLDRDAEDAWMREPLLRRMMLAEYGECLTVHKSQGSQWDHVGVVIDRAWSGMAESDPDQYRRMLYTAVTRAAKHLTVFEVAN